MGGEAIAELHGFRVVPIIKPLVNKFGWDLRDRGILLVPNLFFEAAEVFKLLEDPISLVLNILGVHEHA